MQDTEPMPVVSSAPQPARRGRPPFAIGVMGAIAAIALVACAYLRGEVVALRAELRTARIEARVADRAADRARLDAETARTALASAEATPAPDPVDNDGN